MEILVDDRAAAPGEVFRGRVVEAPEGPVEVVLRGIEVGTDQRVVAAGPVTTDAGQGHRFELPIPATAVPGFEGRHVSRRWSIDATGRGIRRPAAQLAVEVVPHPPSVPAHAVAGLAVEVLRTAQARGHRGRYIGELIMVVMFWLIAGAMLVAGVVAAIRPPEAWDGSRAPALVPILASPLFFLPGFLRLRNIYRPKRVRGARIVSVTDPVRRGDTIEVQLDLDEGTRVRVGHIVTSGRLLRVGTHANPRGGGWRHRVEHESWAIVDAAAPRVALPVPTDVPPTYPGKALTVAHTIRVQPETHRSTRWNFTRFEVPIVVIA